MTDHNLPISLERGLRVLALLNARPGGVAFSEVARLLAISNTSTMRLLRGLVAAGYLRKDTDGLYQLGPRARELGQPADLHERLLRLGRGFLDHLVRTTHQTAITVYHTGTHMVCVDRCLAAGASPLQEPGHLVGELRAAPWGWWFRSVDAWRETPDAPATDRAADNRTIIAGLERAGAHGTTFHDGERRRLAAPVYLEGRIIACLGLGGTPTSLPVDLLVHCQDRLQTAARDFSALLAGP